MPRTSPNAEERGGSVRILKRKQGLFRLVAEALSQIPTERRLIRPPLALRQVLRVLLRSPNTRSHHSVGPLRGEPRGSTSCRAGTMVRHKEASGGFSRRPARERPIKLSRAINPRFPRERDLIGGAQTARKRVALPERSSSGARWCLAPARQTYDVRI
jgi:hypothetical protein